MRTVLIAEILERLASLLRHRQHEAAVRNGLNDAQMAALLYLAKANAYSDTPAGVTEYLGLTKGTVSQTLLALERGGWLKRRADREDGRMVHVQPAAKALRVIEEFRESIEAAGSVPGAADLLTALLAGIQRGNGGRAFGVCHTCRHFRREGAESYRCGLTQEPLAAAQIIRICREHEEPEAA